MKINNFTRNVLLAAIALVIAFGNSEVLFAKNNTESRYKLTIFVDEGKWERNGHVFIGLTAGETTVYGGWYSENKAFDAMWGGDGGVIKNDEHIAACGWDVKKTYNITQEGYQNAVNGMNDWANSGKPWSLRHHCGDFAETIAQMAEVPINIPGNSLTATRPGLFGDYLRKQGSVKLSKTFFVNDLENTNLTINKGDNLAIRASGKVLFGPIAGLGTPEGIDYGTSYNIFDDVNHGALIGRIRTANSAQLDGWFYIGNGLEGIAQSSGILDLNVNDTFTYDNMGKFKVRVCKVE